MIIWDEIFLQFIVLMKNNDSKHIILLGAPGCGKGTQAEELAKSFNFSHLSTGNLFREKYALLNKETREGKASIDKGGFFSTEIAYKMITDFLFEYSNAKGIVYDGFPRNMEQALYFIENITDKPIVIELVVSECKLVERLLTRGKISQREDDSSNEIIERRMKLYDDLTKPLINFFTEKDLLYTVNGEQNIKKIAKDIALIIRGN